MTHPSVVPLLPGLVVAAVLLLGIPAFAWHVRRHGAPELDGLDHRAPSRMVTRLLMMYGYWLLSPFERRLAAAGVSPDSITLAAFGLCVISAVCILCGWFASGGWFYFAAGALDMLDGRVARRTGSASRAGGLLDSVVDRWGELAVLGALLLAMPSTLGRSIVLLAIAGSLMVSYTRARAEGAGITMTSGTMQRAERMLLVVVALLAGAVGESTGAFDAYTAIMPLVLIVGALSAMTAVNRLYQGYRALTEQDRTAVRTSSRE